MGAGPGRAAPWAGRRRGRPGRAVPEALALHRATLDEFELARTRLAYGAPAAPGPPPGRRPAAAAGGAGHLRPARRASRGPTSRPGELAATGLAVTRPGDSPVSRLTPRELQIAAAARRGPDHPGDRGGAVPQPEDGGVPPAARLPEARHRVPGGPERRSSDRSPPASRAAPLAFGTTSSAGGGPGGVPSPNGRPPSCSRPCGVSQPRRSGPLGTIWVGLMSVCTT